VRRENHECHKMESLIRPAVVGRASPPAVVDRYIFVTPAFKIDPSWPPPKLAKSMRKILITILFTFAALANGSAAGPERHVVVVVWDGMRPDFVNQTNTPALYELAQRGVFFAHHHPVYVSSTEVNGTALATGDYPENSGIIGNREFHADIDPLGSFATESLAAMRKADGQGGYLSAPTLAQIFQEQGYSTAIAGCKPVVLLQDHAERPDDATNVVVYEGSTLPANESTALTQALGPFQDKGSTKTNRDIWTARALTEVVWKKNVPAFSLLWLAEPDNTQHGTGVGSPQSLAAIHNSDHALALVVNALKEHGVFDSTDIFVVSDHGFSTISTNVDMVVKLRDAGFKAYRQFDKPPTKGDVLLVGLGGSVLLYVTGHDVKTIDGIVKFLEMENSVGAIFTSQAVPGTFAMEEGLIHSKHAPDIAFSFRWTDDVNVNGAPGEIISEAQGSNITPIAQKATHASLSPSDMHNTLVAAGPDLRRGFIDETPSGNVDVAPTVLKIIGVKSPQPMNGRVLAEALNSSDEKPPAIEKKKVQARVMLPTGERIQTLNVTEVNGVRYLDDATATVTPKETADK
jgi:arylsulfatase A-like enzyme